MYMSNTGAVHLIEGATSSPFPTLMYTAKFNLQKDIRILNRLLASPQQSAFIVANCINVSIALNQ